MGGVEALSDELEPSRHGVLIACAKGVDAWRRTGVPMVVVGDGCGVLWWRSLELRERSSMKTDSSASRSVS
jgi:hypothetical protein